MLIFTRRVGEFVVIAEGVYCKVVSILGNKVCLGFEAPRTLSIHREEVHDIIQSRKQGYSIDELMTDETIVERLIAEFKKPQQTTRAIKREQHKFNEETYENIKKSYVL